MSTNSLNWNDHVSSDSGIHLNRLLIQHAERTTHCLLGFMEFFNDVGTDPLKPSLFELVAQEQLRDLLQPALKYVLAVGPMSIRGSEEMLKSP